MRRRPVDTSTAAAFSVETHTARLRAQVLDAVVRAGLRGVTCDEVEQQLDMRHQTASARIRELHVEGRIADCGARRPTRSGRTAIVWVASDDFPLEWA